MHVLLFVPTVLNSRENFFFHWMSLVLNLAKGLVEKKHKVTIAALEGSVVPIGVSFFELKKNALLDPRLPLFFPQHVDVVHSFSLLSERVRSQIEQPNLLTLVRDAREGEYVPPNTVFLSEKQAKKHGSASFVHPGIDVDLGFFKDRIDQAYFSFVLRDSPTLSQEIRFAMKICKLAKVRLKIFGSAACWERRLGCLWSPYFDWVGDVDESRFLQILSRSKALLYPDAPIRSCAVFFEGLMSLSCGTAVVVGKNSDFNEFLSPLVGFSAQNAEQWVELLSKSVLPYDPRNCREWIQKQFHYAKMCDDYLAFYETLL
jgi:hypothetical protein